MKKVFCLMMAIIMLLSFSSSVIAATPGAIVVEADAKVLAWTGDIVTVKVGVTAIGGLIKNAVGDVVVRDANMLKPYPLDTQGVFLTNSSGSYYLQNVYYLNVGDATKIVISTANFKATDIYGRVGSLVGYKSSIIYKSDF